MARKPDDVNPGDQSNTESVTRRTAVRTGIAGAAAIALGSTTASTLATGGAAQAARLQSPSESLELTPSCTDGDLTPPVIKGPFFKNDAPIRTDLRTPGVTGVHLGLRGRVLNERCQPVRGIEIEFWQADNRGAYDGRGWTLRGRQLSTDEGEYTLETIIPRDYRSGSDWRTPHIHVAIAWPGTTSERATFFTQIFFPDNTQAYGLNFAQMNARDRFYHRKCVITLGSPTPGYLGAFDFVIRPR